VDLRLVGDDLVEQFALAVVLACLDVRLCDRDALAKCPSALRGGNDQARARRSLEDQLPLLGCEVGLARHGSPLARCPNQWWMSLSQTARLCAATHGSGIGMRPSWVRKHRGGRGGSSGSK